MYVCMYVNMYVYVTMCICMYVYVKCMYVHVYVKMYVCKNVCICKKVCMYIELSEHWAFATSDFRNIGPSEYRECITLPIRVLLFEKLHIWNNVSRGWGPNNNCMSITWWG